MVPAAFERWKQGFACWERHGLNSQQCASDGIFETLTYDWDMVQAVQHFWKAYFPEFKFDPFHDTPLLYITYSRVPWPAVLSDIRLDVQGSGVVAYFIIFPLQAIWCLLAFSVLLILWICAAVLYVLACTIGMTVSCVIFLLSLVFILAYNLLNVALYLACLVLAFVVDVIHYLFISITGQVAIYPLAILRGFYAAPKAMFPSGFEFIGTLGGYLSELAAWPGAWAIFSFPLMALIGALWCVLTAAELLVGLALTIVCNVLGICLFMLFTALFLIALLPCSLPWLIHALFVPLLLAGAVQTLFVFGLESEANHPQNELRLISCVLLCVAYICSPIGSTSVEPLINESLPCTAPVIPPSMQAKSTLQDDYNYNIASHPKYKALEGEVEKLKNDLAQLRNLRVDDEKKQPIQSQWNVLPKREEVFLLIVMGIAALLFYVYKYFKIPLYMQLYDQFRKPESVEEVFLALRQFIIVYAKEKDLKFLKAHEADVFYETLEKEAEKDLDHSLSVLDQVKYVCGRLWTCDAKLVWTMPHTQEQEQKELCNMLCEACRYTQRMVNDRMVCEYGDPRLLSGGAMTVLKGLNHLLADSQRRRSSSGQGMVTETRQKITTRFTVMPRAELKFWRKKGFLYRASMPLATSSQKLPQFAKKANPNEGMVAVKFTFKFHGTTKHVAYLEKITSCKGEEEWLFQGYSPFKITKHITANDLGDMAKGTTINPFEVELEALPDGKTVRNNVAVSSWH